MEAPPQRARGRLWLTVGEIAAVLAVVIAGLNYWDSHREHEAQSRRDAAQAQRASLASSLALEGQVQAGGRRLALKAVDADEVIEAQRYVFPRSILDHPVDVTAAAPGVEAAQVAPGLARALESRHAPASGAGRLPVAIITSYLAGGEVRQDRSLYLVGYSWRRRFLRGMEVGLQGLAFRGRLGATDPQAAADRAWAATR